MATAARDPFDVFIDTLADHQRYHPGLPAEFQQLLASSQAAATTHSTSSHRLHNPQQPMPPSTLGKHVKRVVNQTLSTLTLWSKVLNSPDSSDMVPREKASSADSAATAATPTTAATAASSVSAAATSGRPGTSTRTRVAHTFGQKGAEKLGPVKSSTATTKGLGAATTTTVSNHRSGRTAAGSSRGEKKRPALKAGPSSTAPPETTALSASAASVYATEQPTYNHVAIVVDIGFLSIATLESIGDEVSGSLLEVEKARSNMITKIVHLGMVCSNGAAWVTQNHHNVGR